MTTEQILSIYNVGKSIIANSNSKITINRTYLETYSLPVWTGASTTSALGYYQSSLDEIIKIMKINLGLEKATLIKTFSIDYNEEYESKAYGEGLRTGPQEAIMPNLIGTTIEYATNWAKENELTPYFEYVDSSSEHYNPSLDTNVIADQNIMIGTLLNDKKTVTFYINKEQPKKEIIEEKEEKEEKEEEQITHIVSFVDSDDGKKINSKKVVEGEKVIKPTNPTKEGYLFDGWYENEACTKEFDFTIIIEEDTTIYAKWKEDKSKKEEKEEEKEEEPEEDEEESNDDDEEED